jgi:hypothetical protein
VAGSLVRGSAKPPHKTWSSKLDMPEVVRLLEEPGCVLCRTGDGAEQTWLRWFEIENHTSVPVLLALRDSLGFCPAHARRLVLHYGPAVLRQPWEFTVRAAIARAEQLRDGREAPARPAPCPACQIRAASTQGAARTLADVVELPEIRDALPAQHGLCYPHLQQLLPKLPPATAATAADAVVVALAGPADPWSLLAAAAGSDVDAADRARFGRAAIADHHAEHTAGLRARDRLVADLAAGACPACHAAGRAGAEFLAWLCGDEHVTRGPTEQDAQLCPRHLYDTACLAGPRTWPVEIRRGGIQMRAAGLARAAAALAAAPPRPRRRGRPAQRGGGDSRVTPHETHRLAASAVLNDHSCRCCRVERSAAGRQLALLAASGDDRRVLRALDDGHGPCLRHAEQLAGQPGAEPFLRRLQTQLRQTEWELAEDARKQAWDTRHERRGREAGAWRRLPMMLDGSAYLGTSVDASGDAPARPGTPEPG